MRFIAVNKNNVFGVERMPFVSKLQIAAAFFDKNQQEAVIIIPLYHIFAAAVVMACAEGVKESLFRLFTCGIEIYIRIFPAA